MPDRLRPGIPTTAPSIGASQDGGGKYATGTQEPGIKLQAEKTIIGTWNTRTLYACGKLQELTHELERYKWDILGLAEVRWVGFGETTTEKGHKLWFSGDDSKHQHGVGFLVNKKRISSVISCTPVSSRLISIRIAAKPQNMTIIQVYAPTTDYDDETNEQFYEDLENVIRSTPKKDILVIQGDWNAKIGPDAYDQWPGTVGRFGVDETNDRGLRLLEFANSHNLTVANTLFPHKTSRRTTWHSPNGETHNQIDYILAPKRYKSSINKAQTRTFPGADIGSDHDMVLMTLQIKLKTKNQKRNPRLRFNLEKLKDPEVAEIFKAEIGGRFAALNFLQEDLNSLTETFSETIQETALEILGKERKKNQPWVTSDILDLCDKRRELKPEKNKNPEKAQEYRTVNKSIRKKMTEAKENWMSEQCSKVEKATAKGDSKEAYQTIKVLTKSQQPKTSVIEDKEGSVLTESAAVLKRWTEYCDDLYNYKLKADLDKIHEQEPRSSDPGSTQVLEEEVEEAVRSLKGGKSPGIDNIPAELIKYGGPEMIKALTIICQRIWTSKEWPKQWTQSIIVPLPKKGDLKKCQNYRTISLISHPSKVMLRIALNRLKPQAEEILAEEQAGFRAGRSTVEQIFNIQLLIEKHLQHQMQLYNNFIDYKKAFDRVWQEALWQVMRDYNLDEDLIQVIQALYDSSNSAVLMGGEIGEFFRTSVGVRQGCLLSPVLFNIFLENIMQEALLDFKTTVTIGGRPVCNLRFADDIDLMARSEEELQDLTTRLETSANAYGMEISTEKSKILVNSTTPTTPTNIKMSGETLEEVETFKYLGAVITKEGTSTQEVKIRLAMALSSMSKLVKVWRSHNIRTHTKVRLYKALITSIALYGCEAWTLTAELERRIQAFEMKCLRRILNINYRDRKTNEYVWQHIEAMAGKQEPLLATVKRRKMQWFGHTTRHNSLPKTVLQGTVEGGRKQGRPRKSWMSNIKEWTGLSFPTLLKAAQDRTTWRATCSVHAGTPTVPQTKG